MKVSRTIQEMGLTELGNLRGQISNDLAQMARDRADLVARLHAVEAEISARKAKPAAQPAISDHALLRYMERVMGYDVEGLRAKILNPSLVAAINSGAAKYHADGVEMLIRDRTVVTLAA